MNKKPRSGKDFTYYMRAFHRDIGFLVIGLTIVYALSGIVLVYRTTSFLKTPTPVEVSLPTGLSITDISRAIQAPRIRQSAAEDGVIFFDGGAVSQGRYETATGTTRYIEDRLPVVIERFIRLHKASSNSNVHWFAVIYGIMLLFLAVSGMFMFKPRTPQFRRGMVIAGAGLAGTIILILFV